MGDKGVIFCNFLVLTWNKHALDFSVRFAIIAGAADWPLGMYALGEGVGCAVHIASTPSQVTHGALCEEKMYPCQKTENIQGYHHEGVP